MKISFFVVISFFICPGFCANISSIDFETILKALGLTRSIRVCVDPFINVLHDSFERESPINDLPKICSSYNNTKKCFQENNVVSDVKIFKIATSGINNLCTQKWPFLEKNRKCLVTHSSYKAKACDAKCNMLKSSADLSHDQQVIFWAESGGNLIKMLTKLGDICSATRCFLPCYRDQLNQSCKRAGGMIVDGLLKPFYHLAYFVKNAGPLVQQFLAVNMPPTCKFLTNEILLKNIRKGENPQMGVLQDGRVAAAVAATAGVGILTSYFVYRNYREHQYWNSAFIPVGYVKELFVHPIKSTKAIKPQWIECTAKGAKYEENQDRSFLIVDARLEHLFLTARQYPKLVLIESTVKNNVLTVKTPDGDSVEVDLAEVIQRNDVRRGILFEKKTQDGYDCGDDVAQLIANWLNVADKRDIRLIYYADGLQTERDFTTDPSFWLNPVPIVPDTPAYQDLASFMLCTEASADELNGRLAKLGDDKCTVSVRNFRPNINVAGTIPFDEDRWLEVKIGEAEFACFKPCTRCVLTTVDPDKGAFNKNMQPLRLLRSYRLAPKGKLLDLYGESPIFGVNMMAKKYGKINIGDQVFVRYKPTPL